MNEWTNAAKLLLFIYVFAIHNICVNVCVCDISLISHQVSIVVSVYEFRTCINTCKIAQFPSSIQITTFGYETPSHTLLNNKYSNQIIDNDEYKFADSNVFTQSMCMHVIPCDLVGTNMCLCVYVYMYGGLVSCPPTLYIPQYAIIAQTELN